MTSRHVRRVDQLDSLSFDTELFALLNAQYQKAFLYVPSFVVAKIGPEIDVLFKFIFKFMPLKYLNATFGQNMFDLTYLDSETSLPASVNKLRLLTIINVGLPWFWNRVVRQMLVYLCGNDRSRHIFESTNNIELRFLILWKIISLINFCVFLQKSTFSTVSERILRMRPYYSTSQEIKVMQYDRISRELMWHGFSEFLGFTLPLINVFRIKNYMKRKWLLWSKNNSSKQRLENENCLICGGIPNFPHSMGCIHRFCYYCIASMLLVDSSFTCLHCNLSGSGLDCIKAVPINRPEIK